MFSIRGIFKPIFRPSANPFVSRRGLRRIIRTRLPKYKKNIRYLPPLTKLLTSDEFNVDPINLQKEKLAIYKEYMPVGANTNLIEALFNENNDADRLLTIIGDNLETMTSFYTAISFEVLDDMMRTYRVDPATVAVAPEFKKLCIRALFKVRYFEADEILKLIKCLATLRMPEDFLLVQAALQMARHLINDFDDEELDCLCDCLNRFKIAGDSSMLEGKKNLRKALQEARDLLKRREVQSLAGDSK